MSKETALAEYYAQRALQYERVYHKPERQTDLRTLRGLVAAAVEGKRVLEVACGTGYWTELISHRAASVVALDLNEEVLALARARRLVPGKVTFLRGDAYALPELPGPFDAGLAGFWWSHVSRARLSGFLTDLHRALAPGATVMFFENAYVAGSSTPLSQKASDGHPVSAHDSDGDTYQERVLDDGSRHRVLKNFPTAEELRQVLAGRAVEVDIWFLTYYWILTYRLP
jgi:demethylmenaquinone methyltransferase/2-methoxy-6-polyprenyl-1,4-benzoquinol methylase